MRHHIITHLLSLLEPFTPLTESATRAASVKASLTPRLRFAEHSDTIISDRGCMDGCEISIYLGNGELGYAVRLLVLPCR